MSKQNVGNIVATTQAYYDGPADEIYRTIWGDNLHLGVPCGATIARTLKLWNTPTPSWPRPSL